MDIRKMIVDLREELECLDRVISELEKLSMKQKPRRGRPPAWSKVTATNLTAPTNGNGLNNAMNG